MIYRSETWKERNQLIWGPSERNNPNLIYKGKNEILKKKMEQSINNVGNLKLPNQCIIGGTKE